MIPSISKNIHKNVNMSLPPSGSGILLQRAVVPVTVPWKDAPIHSAELGLPNPPCVTVVPGLLPDPGALAIVALLGLLQHGMPHRSHVSYVGCVSKCWLIKNDKTKSGISPTGQMYCQHRQDALMVASLSFSCCSSSCSCILSCPSELVLISWPLNVSEESMKLHKQIQVAK